MGWDDGLPLELVDKWMRYREEYKDLQNITVPRWVTNVEVHGFADTSTHKYATVTYLMVIEEDTVRIIIIASRTKNANFETSTKSLECICCEPSGRHNTKTK